MAGISEWVAEQEALEEAATKDKAKSEEYCGIYRESIISMLDSTTDVDHILGKLFPEIYKEVRGDYYNEE